MRAEREGAFARPHSSDPSARRKVSPRAEVLASMRVEEQKRKSRRGKRAAAAAANLNQRFQFQSLLFGGTTDKSIITLNQSERGGSLDVLRCQGPWKSSRSTCSFTPFFTSSRRAQAE